MDDQEKEDSAMRWMLFVLVVLGGAVIPVQVAANKRIEQSVRSPALAATLAFFAGGVALAAFTATGLLGRGELRSVNQVPWWSWAAAAMSIFIVVSIIALPRIGAAAVIAATVFGQLTAAVLIDHFGWLNVPQVRLNWGRLLGVILLFAGPLLIQ